jgi:hypothetical protein
VFAHRAAYTENVKQIWAGRVARAAGKYGEQAPMATVCCNACRTCVTMNVFALATGAIAGAGFGIARLGRRLVARLA